MASGYGMNGGVSRCFPFWQDFLACYVINTEDGSPEGRWRCLPQRNDYYECLHHGREMEKTKVIREAYLRRLKEGAKPGAPEGGPPGAVKPIGVIGGGVS